MYLLKLNFDAITTPCYFERIITYGNYKQDVDDDCDPNLEKSFTYQKIICKNLLLIIKALSKQFQICIKAPSKWSVCKFSIEYYETLWEFWDQFAKICSNFTKNFIVIRGKFKTLSNINDRAFMQQFSTAKRPYNFLQKAPSYISIILLLDRGNISSKTETAESTC